MSQSIDQLGPFYALLVTAKQGSPTAGNAPAASCSQSHEQQVYTICVVSVVDLHASEAQINLLSSVLRSVATERDEQVPCRLKETTRSKQVSYQNAGLSPTLRCETSSRNLGVARHCDRPDNSYGHPEVGFGPLFIQLHTYWQIAGAAVMGGTLRTMDDSTLSMCCC